DLSQIPGVLSASLSLYGPMSGSNWESAISIEGRPVPLTPADRISSSWNRVSPGYFETIGTHLGRGRLFDDRDKANSSFVTVVNEAFVKKHFPREDPIGKRFGLGTIEHSRDYEIVGIVEDAKYDTPYGPVRPMFFLPLMQMTPVNWTQSMLARSNF